MEPDDRRDWSMHGVFKADAHTDLTPIPIEVWPGGRTFIVTWMKKRGRLFDYCSGWSFCERGEQVFSMRPESAMPAESSTRRLWPRLVSLISSERYVIRDNQGQIGEIRCKWNEKELWVSGEHLPVERQRDRHGWILAGSAFAARCLEFWVSKDELLFPVMAYSYLNWRYG